MRNSGHQDELNFQPKTRQIDEEERENQKRRKRKVIWYNPPFSQSVKTNIGKTFLNLIRKHFHPLHRLNKIFNTRTLKISYSCMPNMSSIISSHNKHILRAETDSNQRMCNCTRNAQCPLDGQCLSRNICYEAKVNNVTDEIVRPYVGATSTTWKERKGVHNQGINHRKYSKQCELTKYIWTLKDAGKQFSIQWRILERVKGRTIAGECKLCVAEKLHILSHPQKELLLNNKTTIQCTHKIKDSLASLYSNRGRPRGRTIRRGNIGVRETSN